MADQLKEVGTPDSNWINVNEDHEVKYWTKALGVSETKLKEVIQLVGTSAEAVRKALGK